MSNHLDIVQQVKAELEAKGVSLSGPCGAFAITKRVAWRLRAEGAGLLDKPGGNNCEGFATDIVCYPSGQIVDVLSDGGGINGPTWQEKGTEDASRYRPAVDPGDDVVVPPPPPPLDLSEIVARLATIEAELAEVDKVLEALRDKPASVIAFPNYSGRIAGFGVTLRPEK
jgi:hypothetical protein